PTRTGSRTWAESAEPGSSTPRGTSSRSASAPLPADTPEDRYTERSSISKTWSIACHADRRIPYAIGHIFPRGPGFGAGSPRAPKSVVPLPGTRSTTRRSSTEPGTTNPRAAEPMARRYRPAAATSASIAASGSLPLRLQPGQSNELTNARFAPTSRYTGVLGAIDAHDPGGPPGGANGPSRVPP